jgi:primosomal protein N' (replication factor Y)
VATRGTEPLAATGYSAVILLDADRMLSAPALRAEEEALRVWSNASALARPGSKIVLTEASGLLASCFAVGTVDRWLDSVLTERKVLRYPPAVRVATMTGPPAALDSAEDALHGIVGYDVIPASNGRSGDDERLVRFEYGVGSEVATALRQALVANATVSRRRTREPHMSRVTSSLRLHFDDPAAFDERLGRRAGKGTKPDTVSAHPTDLEEKTRLQ